FTRAKSIEVTRSASDWICPVKQSLVSNVTTAPGSTSRTGSRSGPNAQITSSRETRCPVTTAIGGGILPPRRRIEQPAAAHHRRDHLAAGQILDRIAAQDHEIRKVARQQLPAAALVAA